MRRELSDNLRRFRSYKSMAECFYIIQRQFKYINIEVQDMDKKIKKIQRDTKKVSGELKGLLKADKKQDKMVAKAKKGKC